MICIPVSVKHHACAQPDQATNSGRSSASVSANASALLKHTVATEDAGRYGRFPYFTRGGVFLNPGKFCIAKIFSVEFNQHLGN